MIISSSSLLVSCAKKLDSGNEAAKLLLANERLDEKVLTKIDLGIDTSKAKHLNAGTPLKYDYAEQYMRLSDQMGVHYTWTEFEEHSHSMVEFTQFMNSIENKVEDVAGNIETMKKNVGVTDKWVDGGLLQNEERMLRVFENMDMLLIKLYDHNALYVCTRYTGENAKNVYEIFSFYKYDSGDTARMRLIYIPGEYYEWSSQHSNGFSDYFVAENTRGYWAATRFDVSEYSAAFNPLIINNGLGYGGHVEFAKEVDRFGGLMDFITLEGGMSVGAYNVFDPATNREYFRIYDSNGYGIVELYFTGIKSGLVSVSTSEAYVDVEDNVYQTNALDTLVTSNGTYNTINDKEAKGEFYFSGGYVQHYYGDNFDYGNITFQINYENQDDTISDYIIQFSDFAKSIGLELYCDMDSVKESIYHAREYCVNFDDVFKWNSLPISSYESAVNAKEAFIASTDVALNYYEEVKDYPKAENKQKLSSDVKFADIANLVMGENTYAEGKVVISNVGVSITDTTLFEAGLDYVLKIGLALCDSDGNPISVNTVPLKTDSENKVTYTGGDIMLNGSGSYDIPKNLSQEEYVLVVYASNTDGIRVSEMKKLAFVSIEEGELDSTAMNIEITKVSDNLHATYTIKNTRYIEMSYAKENYSYNEVRREIMQEILSYGCPDSNAVLEYENGNEVEKDAVLGKGTYRMIGYFPTSDGLAQSYVYLTIE